MWISSTCFGIDENKSLFGLIYHFNSPSNSDCSIMLSISLLQNSKNEPSSQHKIDGTGYYLIKTGDFAYNKSRSQGYPYGAIKPLKLYDKGVVSTLYICFRTKEQNSCIDFYEHYFETDLIHNEIGKIAQEGARNHGLLNISTEDFFEKISLFIPSLPEQQKIASFLTLLDEQISAHTKKLEALKAHKKGLMQQLFPANGEKTPKLRFPEFINAGEWKEVRLGEIGTLKNGYAFKSDSYKESGVYKIITISNVKNGYLDLSKYNTINKIPSDISDHQILSIEDILISMTGNVGRVCMVSETDCLLNQRVGIFQVYEGINKYFIFSILNSPSFENAMILAAQGAAQPNIGKFDIEKFSLLMPPTTFEQQKIASFLTSIDEMIQAQDDKIQKLKTYKNGLMQQMFAK